MSRRVLVLLFDGCELLDFAGPVQALHEASARGETFDIHYCGESRRVRTAQGLIVDAHALPEPRSGDWLVIPGYTVDERRRATHGMIAWLRKAYDAGARICSVCTGAFLLAEAGLLAGRQCTTHWKRVEQLQQRFPNAKVLGERLYVEDNGVITSAGISAGIDMVLWLLERDYGPALAAEVAREMVVYMRRDGSHRQESVYLDYQTHLHPGVHRIQQYLGQHPAAIEPVATLAHRFGMSERSLRRAFKSATGITVQGYRTRLRIEHARVLLRNPTLTVDAIADQCGFRDGRQLRRLLQQHLGMTATAARRSSELAR